MLCQFAIEFMQYILPVPQENRIFQKKSGFCNAQIQDRQVLPGFLQAAETHPYSPEFSPDRPPAVF